MPQSPAMTALQEAAQAAAGNHARRVQIEERAQWMSRDLMQASNAAEMCNRQGELVSLIDLNNQGPAH